ncbi:MAG: lytic transglycosylase domain-containing protein [Nanoarchaeota archaeon]
MSFESIKKRLPTYFSVLAAAILSWHSYADGAPKRKHAQFYPPFTLASFQKHTYDYSFRVDDLNENTSLDKIIRGTLLPKEIDEKMFHQYSQTLSESKNILERESRIEEAYLHYRNREGIARNFTQTIHCQPYATLINQALSSVQDKYNVKIPYSLFISLVQGESNWSTGVTSKAGAQGLMQFMPDTSKAFGCNPRSARQLLCGGQFLAKFYQKYERDVPGFKKLPEEEKWNWVLLGYNWGPNGIPGLIRNTGARTVWDLTRKHLGAEAYEFVPKMRGIERAYKLHYQNPPTS